jgi:hypothetical protein
MVSRAISSLGSIIAQAMARGEVGRYVVHEAARTNRVVLGTPLTASR